VRTGWVVIILPVILFPCSGCRFKVEQLPEVNYPYISEVEFLKEVRNDNGKARKTPFKNGRITSPFFIFVKIREIEDSGMLAIRFYGSDDKGGGGERMEERTFRFGEDGKYYEYIIFFDRIDGLAAGEYRYAVFFRGKLLYEDRVRVFAGIGGN